MKISAKLTIAFIAVAALALIVGIVGITQLTSTKAQEDNLFQNYGNSQGMLGRVEENFLKCRITVRDMLMEKKVSSLSDYQAKLKTYDENIQTYMKQFYATCLLQSEKDDYKKLSDEIIKYQTARDQVVSIAAKGDFDGAYAYQMSTLVTEPANSSLQLLENNVQSNIDLANSISKQLTSTVNNIIIILIVIVIVAVLAAITLGMLMSRSISKPINQVVAAANKLAAGDTDITLSIKAKDETGMLAKSIEHVVVALKKMIADANMLAAAAVDGKLSTRADASAHEGDYKKIVGGINKTLDAVINPLNVAAEQLDRMATGVDLPVIDETKFNGDFKVIAMNLNKARASLYLLLEDSGMLAAAAAEGKLSARADITRHKGGYAGIISGINDTLDSVINPINEAAAVLQEMSKGNLSVSMNGSYNGDLALIKNSLNDTIDTIKGYINDISSSLSELAAGNLSVSITSEYRGDFVEIKSSINNISESLNSVMSEISNASEQVASGTQQVSSGSQALSQGATEQASSIEELTASLSEIAGQTRQNAINAGQANDLALAARDSAADGKVQMGELQQAMTAINESSAKISKVIKVIDDIAFQTNLLALNAAVEAARAGQYGKGFAVVAEEVRNLAQRSANAAKETTEMIEGSIKKVQAGTQIANGTASALVKIVDSVEKATELVGGIAKASNDQAMAVAQVNTGIEQVSQVTQTNSATAEESAAASEELSSQAALLKEMVGRFSLRGQAHISGQKVSFQPQAPTRAIVAGKPASGKPKIALNDREFGKY
jgi:methyl-accepting chemotaxis protein